MTTIWTCTPATTPSCRCVVLRTRDREEAVALAREHGWVLDSWPCRTEEAERAVLEGAVVGKCECETVEESD